jgi:hypothetical protein
MFAIFLASLTPGFAQTSARPPMPTGLKAVASLDPARGPRVDLTWNAYPAAANGVSRLRIVRDAVVLQPSYPTAWTGFADYGDVSYTTTYTFKLIAVKSDGTASYAATATVTTPGKSAPDPGGGTTPPPPSGDETSPGTGGTTPPPTTGGTTPGNNAPPAAPANFTAVWVAGQGVVLKWSAVAGAVKYPIHRASGTSGNPDTLPPIATTTSTTYTDPVVQTSQAQTFMYCPAATDAAGQTGPCATDVMVTVPPAATLPSQPANLAPMAVAATYANDDSVVIRVNPVPGAADYIVFDSANPLDVKASGGNLLVEWNGYPIKGKLIVQALAQLAPFQPHMISMPGMTGAAGALHVANGQGPTTNTLKPIAQSAPFTPGYSPFTATPGASQVAIDTFNPPASVMRVGNDTTYLNFATSDGKWRGTAFNADFINTDPMFISHTHGMWDLKPGMTPGQGPQLQQNATVTWEFLPGVADISGGRVAHFSIECDSHFPQNRRRWWEIYAIPAGDAVLNPENLDVLNNGGTDFSKVKPTTSGNLLAWMIDGQYHELLQVLWENNQKALYPVTHTQWNDPAGASDRFGPCLRGVAEGPTTHPYAGGKTLNGGIQDLDLRHRFDIYLSQNRVRIEETDAEGYTVRVLDRALVKPLPFTTLRWVVTGKVYHPLNDVSEITGPDRAYYWSGPSYGRDMRHLDNALSEVLGSFPP